MEQVSTEVFELLQDKSAGRTRGADPPRAERSNHPGHLDELGQGGIGLGARAAHRWSVTYTDRIGGRGVSKTR
jgi:hypothetical protein